MFQIDLTGLYFVMLKYSTRHYRCKQISIFPRMGILESALLFGVLFGSLSSSYAYNALNYTGVFGICIVMALLGIFSTVLLEESLTTTPNNEVGFFMIYFIFDCSITLQCNINSYLMFLFAL